MAKIFMTYSYNPTRTIKLHRIDIVAIDISYRDCLDGYTVYRLLSSSDILSLDRYLTSTLGIPGYKNKKLAWHRTNRDPTLSWTGTDTPIKYWFDTKEHALMFMLRWNQVDLEKLRDYDK
jgi:hypothetical protein